MMFLYRPYRKHQTPPPIRLFFLVRSAAIPAKVGRGIATATIGRHTDGSSTYKGIGNGEYLCAK